MLYQKRALRPITVRVGRGRLEILERRRGFALCKLAINSKLRG